LQRSELIPFLPIELNLEIPIAGEVIDKRIDNLTDNLGSSQLKKQRIFSFNDCCHPTFPVRITLIIFQLGRYDL
jgi:hypothetical protein